MAPLAVQVLDSNDNPVEGAQVTFTFPGSGASAFRRPKEYSNRPNGLRRAGQSHQLERQHAGRKIRSARHRDLGKPDWPSRYHDVQRGPRISGEETAQLVDKKKSADDSLDCGGRNRQRGFWRAKKNKLAAARREWELPWALCSGGQQANDEQYYGMGSRAALEPPLMAQSASTGPAPTSLAMTGPVDGFVFDPPSRVFEQS